MKAMELYSSYSRKSGKHFNYKAFLLLILFLFDTVRPVFAATYSGSPASADGTPIAELAMDMVDLYTGDFNYSLPLVTVPGPNGERIEVTATYNAGIAVDQHAGMLGLGWSINTGEITRNVVGVPDDFAGQPVESLSIPNANISLGFGTLKNSFSYGPFYFNKINTTTSYSPLVIIPGVTTNYSTDNLIVESGINRINPVNNQSYATIGGSQAGPKFFPRYFASPTASFAMPAYDNYIVSGHGIGGKIQPYIFSTRKPNSSQYYHTSLYSGTSPKSTIRQNRKTQFHFEGSSYASALHDPSDLTTNRLKSGYFVKYYTNSEINTAANLFSNSTYTGFLDYRVVSSGTRRPAADYDPNSIGGIEITNTDGFTYHYSLPIIVHSSVDKSFDNTEVTLVHKPWHVSSWKLTAITGPDYKDRNNNKVADLGDIGYWVEYKYGLWSKDFYESSILYARQNDLGSKTGAKLNYKAGGFSMNETRSEKYYLDHIRTSTHTAYFVKDVRLDEHSSEFGQNAAKVNPSLKLNRIVLLRNEHRHLMEGYISNWDLTGLNAKFMKNLLSSPQDYSLIHINKYKGSKTLIDKVSLRSVEFKQDYSLCKKYYANINNSFGAVSCLNKTGLTTAELQDFKKLNSKSEVLYSSVNPVNFSTTDLNNSGKLTLNEVQSYEDGGVVVFNAHKFDYRQSNAAKNPDYDPLKKDMWGYYKCDHDGNPTNTGFPTCASATAVDAWSLAKITLPDGASIEMEYESDTYSSEGFDEMKILNAPVFGPAPGVPGDYDHSGEANQAIKSPHYIYPVASVSTANYLPNITGWENSDKSYLEASVYGGNTMGLTCENRGSGSIYAVPVPVSCSSLSAGQGILSDAPEFFIGWNGQSAGANSPHGGKWPNIEDKHCASQSNMIYQPYNKAKWYGYHLQSATWLYGGGIRVKSIKFNEPESGLAYVKEFEYYFGYCAAPPKRYMLGLIGGNTFYTLWNNTYNYIPYINLTNVGYGMVRSRNKNTFAESNGRTDHYFSNRKFEYNPISITPTAHDVAIPITCNDGGEYILPICSPGSTTNCQTLSPSQTKHIMNYTLNAVFSNADYKSLGHPEKVEKYDNNNTLVYAKTFSYGTYNIVEEYDVSFLNKSNNVKRFAKLKSGQSPFNFYVDTYCDDTENYSYFSSYINSGRYLSSTDETIDGITTKTSFDYDPFTTLPIGTTITSPTDGIMKTTIEYAYQNPVSPLGLKMVQESKLNKLSEPMIIRKYKGGTSANNPNELYLVSETVNDYWNYRVKIREFDPTVNTANPNGCYGVNVNSGYTTNDVIAYQTWQGLIGTNMTAASPFNFPNNHRSTGEPTMFDKTGKVLERFGLNGRYSAVKMGYNHQYPVASISNARYTSFGFTSFEDTVTVAPNVVHFGGEFSGANTRQSYPWYIKAHTGVYLSQVGTQSTGPGMTCRLFDLNRTYEAKVWVHKLSPNNAHLQINLKGQNTSMAAINITSGVYKNDPANIQVGDWILMKCRLDVPANVYIQDGSYLGYNLTPDLTVSLDNSSTTQEAYFDDLMFGPVDAPITGNVYDLRTGRLIASLDDENFASYFNYDAAGRIISTYKETKAYGVVKLSEKEYNNCRSTKNIFNTGGTPSPSSK